MIYHSNKDINNTSVFLVLPEYNYNSLIHPKMLFFLLLLFVISSHSAADKNCLISKHKTFTTWAASLKENYARVLQTKYYKQS